MSQFNVANIASLDNVAIEKDSLVLQFYEKTGANILKAYTHNKEALRLHELGSYKAARHHAERAKGLSLKASEQIELAIELAKKLMPTKGIQVI